MNEYKVTYDYLTPEEESSLADCQDASWYMSSPTETHEHVATVSVGDKCVMIYRDGVMRVHLWDSAQSRGAGDAPTVVRDTKGLHEMGITTDAELEEAHDCDRVEWLNNAWFDLYSDDVKDGDTWLDRVAHSLNEAVADAQRWLDENCST
jgi:hypothetical protein